MFRQLTARYGWLPREIAGLTLAQALALLRPEVEDRRARRMPVAAGLALAAKLAEERRAAIERWIRDARRPQPG